MKKYNGIFVEEETIDSADDYIGAVVVGFALGLSVFTLFVLWYEGII